MKPMICAFAILLFLGCSQDGDITVHNQSGPDLAVSFDGATYYLDDGEVVTRRVDIGRKFIFGSDDRAVAVSGEGYCKLPFREVVVVSDRQSTMVPIYGDAGYIDICNDTGYAFELYLSSCASDDWEELLEIVPDGICTTWMVEDGCWDMLTVSIDSQFEEYNIFVQPCDFVGYDIQPAALVQGKGEGLKGVSARDGAVELRKRHAETRER